MEKSHDFGLDAIRKMREKRENAKKSEIQQEIKTPEKSNFELLREQKYKENLQVFFVMYKNRENFLLEGLFGIFYTHFLHFM